ncbi:MAG: tetratricopeptide repeat protein [Phycisphaerae bacterium]|nr:tetratricopeptide repeat protein [Phycisphaerae bacterium]
MSNEASGNNNQVNEVKQHLRISTLRLWLFRIIAVLVIPVLVLVLLEVALRVAGYGYPTAAFVKCQVNGRPFYHSNNKFGWRFFPPEISRVLPPFVIDADKSPNSYRIFILGESAAMGVPDPSYNFGRVLHVMLRQQYPSVNFEIFTAAMVAINSHSIVQIAKDCAKLKPDLFVVYAGNNEVVGPYGAGTIFTPLSKSLFLIRMGLAIKATRLGQLMMNLTNIANRAKMRQETWGGLEMFLGNQIRHDDKQMQYVYSHFRHNLGDIARIAKKSGAKVLFSTVAVNLKDCPPLSSLHRPDFGDEQKQQFDSLYRNGIWLEEMAGDFKGAIDKYLAAAEIDDTYAELHFRLGRCQWNLGQFDKARQRYAQALELDTLRFRADSSINQIIREVGENRQAQDIYFVDAVEAFEKESPHNCPGFESFFEHVHFTFPGTYLLARTVFDRVEQILPDGIKEQKARDAALPSEDTCADQLAFTVYDRSRVTQAMLEVISETYPFINQAYHKEIVDFWRQKLEQLNSTIGPTTCASALEQYERAIDIDKNDYWLRNNFAGFLWKTYKHPLAAIRQYCLVTEQVPYDHHVLIALATMEARIGNNDDLALKHALLATKYMPTDFVANHLVGALYQTKGQYKKAQRYMAKAIRLNPKLTLAYISMGKILIQQGKTEQAEQIYRKGIETVPDNPDLYIELASLLRTKGLLEEAEKERQKAISLDPNAALSHGSAPDPMNNI